MGVSYEEHNTWGKRIMKVIAGGARSGKTRKLIQEFIEKRNDSILLVASKAHRSTLLKEYQESLRLYGVNENRIVDPASLKLAMTHFKPLFLMVDDMKTILTRALDIRGDARMEAMTINLDAGFDSIEVFNRGES